MTLDIDLHGDGEVTVPKSELRGLVNDARRWKGKAAHERSRREKWRKRSLNAEAQAAEAQAQIDDLRRVLYNVVQTTGVTAIWSDGETFTFILDHEAGMAWDEGDPYGPV